MSCAHGPDQRMKFPLGKPLVNIIAKPRPTSPTQAGTIKRWLQRHTDRSPKSIPLLFPRVPLLAREKLGRFISVNIFLSEQMDSWRCRCSPKGLVNQDCATCAIHQLPGAESSIRVKVIPMPVPRKSGFILFRGLNNSGSHSKPHASTQDATLDVGK